MIAEGLISRLRPLVLGALVGFFSLTGASLVMAQQPPYYAVTINGGALAVWRVDADGQISPHWSQALPGGATCFFMDPFGRHLWTETGAGPNGDRLELWRIEQDFTLSLADVYDEGFGHWLGTYSQDGNRFVSMSTDLDTFDTALQTYQITPDLQIEPIGTPLPIIVPGDELSSISTYTLSSQGDGVIIAPKVNTGEVFIISTNAHGDITWDGTKVTVPRFGSGAVRSDGRLFSCATAPYSLAISGSGEVTLVDQGPDPLPMGGGTVFAPNGQSLVGAFDVTRTGIRRDGTYTGEVESIITSSTAYSDVTSDGKYVLATNFGCGIPGRCLQSFRLTGDVGLESVDLEPGNGFWRDLHFIPPRPGTLPGDANADGIRDVADLVAYIRHFNDPLDIGGPDDPTITGPVPLDRADATGDGHITKEDMEWLQFYLLGLME